MPRSKVRWLFHLSLSCLLCVFVAEAQEPVYELQEIVVTAEKVERNLQQVPMGISVFSDTQIENSGISSLADISEKIPNLTVLDWGSRRNAFLYIRGVGSSRQRDSAVGVNIDDVPLLNNGTFLMDLHDIERIEVLRGPQGTLYGRNTLAGVINIITKEPTRKREVSVSSTFGTYDLREYRASYRGPIIADRFLIGVSAVKSTREGYVDNDFRGGTVDDRDTVAGRLKLHWLPSDNVDVIFSTDAESDQDGAFPLTNLTQVRQNPHHVSHDYKGFEDRDIYGYSLRVEYRGERVTLNSITAWRKWNEDAGIDQDFSPADIIVMDWKEDQTQFTQEVRLRSPDGDARLKWLIGTMYFQDVSGDDRLLEYGADAAAYFGMPLPDGYQSYTFSEFESTGYSVFGQVTYAVSDNLELTTGLRWDHENKDIDLNEYDFFGAVVPGTQNVQSRDKDFDEVIPKVSISYKLSKDMMAYVTVAEGYKSGGFNNFFNVPQDAAYDSEHSWNHEIGLKSEWMENRLTVNLAAFYINSNDQQVVQFLPPNGTIIRNAGKSQSTGFEMEIASAPFPELQIAAGLQIVNATFDDYDDPAAGVSYKDNKIPMAQDQTISLSVQYTHSLSANTSLSVGAELQAIGDFYWDVANTLKEDAYELVNLRFGVKTKSWDVKVWAKNVFDKEYAAIAFDIPGFPTLGQAGEPPTFGITAAARF